jgi:hypothetical protein
LLSDVFRERRLELVLSVCAKVASALSSEGGGWAVLGRLGRLCLDKLALWLEACSVEGLGRGWARTVAFGVEVEPSAFAVLRRRREAITLSGGHTAGHPVSLIAGSGGAEGAGMTDVKRREAFVPETAASEVSDIYKPHQPKSSIKSTAPRSLLHCTPSQDHDPM